MHALLKLLAWGLAVYGLYCGLLFTLQRQMLFPRHMLRAAGPLKPADPWQLLSIPLPDGPVQALLALPADTRRPSPLVVFAHGNGELIDFWPPLLQPLVEKGVGVLLVEYPGYGRSAGDPSQKSITAAMVAAYDLVARRPDVDPARIAFWGRSLGGGAVCQLARHRQAAGLILMSTFTSARSFARRYLVPSVLVKDPFDNLVVVKSFRNPVWVVHGRHDEVIPYRHGRLLAAAAPTGQLITYPSGHNDCPPDWRLFWQDIRPFFMQIGFIDGNKL